jgi:putative membrane protein
MDAKAKNNFFYRALCGAFLGISIIAPGVSGSIMAVIMGVYDDLIDIISDPFKNFKRNVIYVFPMCLGAGLSMILSLKLLRILFDNYPTPAYLLFISLIVGSLPMVFKEAEPDKFKPKYIPGILCAFAFALTVGLLAKNNVAVSVEAAAGASSLAYFSLCGGIAGITSMIPGMSVSMVLMTLGVYEPLLEQAADLNVWKVGPVAVCFIIGMVLFSKLTKFVFRKYHCLGYFLVLGFMFGSVISIFPGLPSGLTDWLASAAAVCVGLGISYLFKVLGKKFGTGD